jgi:hypothetical protein
VFREVITEEGFNIKILKKIGVKFQKLVNLVFRETFFSYHKKPNIPGFNLDVINYYKEVKLQLALQGTEESKLTEMAIDGTSSKFALDIKLLKEILGLEINN